MARSDSNYVSFTHDFTENREGNSSPVNRRNRTTAWNGLALSVLL